MSTLRLISIGLSGALTVTQLASGSASAAAVIEAVCVGKRLILFLAWWGRGGDLDVVRRGGRSLLFLFAVLLNHDVEAWGIDRERHHGSDCLPRILEGLRHLNERAERPANVEVELQRNLAEGSADQLAGKSAAAAEGNLVDRDAGCESARQIAVEPNDHRAVFEVAKQLEYRAGHHPGFGLGAGILEFAAGRPRIQPSTDDAPAV